MKVEIYGSAESHTVRGATVNFNADSAAPVTVFVAEVNPNGFDGRTGVDINKNGTTQSVAFGKTCYGGSANVTTGTLTEEYGGGAYDPQNVPAEVKSEVESKLTLETATPGDIVSFDCELGEYPLNSLSIHLAPIQDLHGYDNPWPAGGGKNKFNPETTTTGYIRGTNGVAVNGAEAWKYGSEYSPVNPNTSYVLYKYETTSSSAAGYALYDENKQYISGAAYGRGVSVAIDTPPNAKYIRASWSSGASTPVALMLSTETETEYSPYENLCPISGWDSVEVERTGVNLLDISTAEVGTAWNGAANTARARLVIPIKRNTQYILTMNGTNSLDDVFSALSTTVPPSGIGGRTFPYSFNSGENDYLVLGFNKTAISQSDLEALNLQLELGSTASTYYPYAGNRYTIQLGQTVYGGTLDVTSGKMYARPYFPNYNGQALIGPWVSSMDAYTPGASPTVGAQVVDMGGAVTEITLDPVTISAISGQNNVWANTGEIGELKYYDGDITDTDIQTENGVLVTGDKLFYALSSPRTSSFTPTAVNTVQGENTMSANTGNIVVTYTSNWFDITPWIAWQGLTFSRNDVDAPNAGRDMSGYMHRGRVAVKEKMNIQTVQLTRAQSSKLQTLLYPETIMVRVTPYPRTNAAQILNMYSNNVKTTYVIHRENGEDLQSLSFPLIEN